MWRVWLLGFSGFVCSPLFAAKLTIDANFKLAIEHLNRINNNNASKVTLVVDDKLSTPIIELRSHHHASTLTYLEDTSFHALFEALKLSIEVTQKYESQPVSVTLVNSFKGLDLDPKKILDHLLVLDTTVLSNDKSLEQMCEKLVLLGFFNRKITTKRDELTATAWLCYALYEVRTKKRDVALLVMLADMLGYVNFAAQKAVYLPKTHPLYKYYYVTNNTSVKTKRDFWAHLFSFIRNKFNDILIIENTSKDNSVRPNVDSTDQLEENNISYDRRNKHNRLRKERDNRYREIRPDYAPFYALLMQKRALATKSAKNWEAMAFSASKGASPSILFNGIEAVPINDLRTKLLMLTPLMLVNDFLGAGQMQYYWYDDKLRTSIEDVSALSYKLAKKVNYPPVELITKFTEQIHAAPSPSGHHLLPTKLIQDYWESRLLTAYVVLVNYLKDQNYSEDTINSLHAVIKKNNQTKIGRILYQWLLASKALPVYDQALHLQDYSQFMSMHEAALGLKFDLLMHLRKYINKEILLPYARTMWKAFDSSNIQLSMKREIEYEFLENESAFLPLYWKRVYLDNALVELLSTLNNSDYIEKLIDARGNYNEDNQLTFPLPRHLLTHRARLLSELFRLGAGDTSRLKQLALIYRQQPNHFGITIYYLKTLIRYTRDRGNKEAALAVLNDWVYTGRDLSRAQYLDLIALLAEVKLNLGEIDAAKRIINPTLKYHHLASFEVAIQIALQSKELEVAKRLVSYFERHFPQEISKISKHRFKLALLSENLAEAAQILLTLPAFLDENVLDQLATIYKHHTMAQKATYHRQFIKQLKENKLPNKKLEAFSNVNLNAKLDK